jgi:RNA polymerase sigma-70 factor (ECF subfamily)
MTHTLIRPASTSADDLIRQDALLDATFRSHAGPLRAKLLAKTRDLTVAEDLVGEAFVRLSIEVRAGRPPRDPAAWLYRVGANLWVSSARRRAVATRAIPLLIECIETPALEDTVMRRERDAKLRIGLASLPCHDQEVLAMAARGHRSADIARARGVSQVAARARLFRARKRLRTTMGLAASPP